MQICLRLSGKCRGAGELGSLKRHRLKIYPRRQARGDEHFPGVAIDHNAKHALDSQFRRQGRIGRAADRTELSVRALNTLAAFVAQHADEMRGVDPFGPLLNERSGALQSRFRGEHLRERCLKQTQLNVLKMIGVRDHAVGGRYRGATARVVFELSLIHI